MFRHIVLLCAPAFEINHFCLTFCTNYSTLCRFVQTMFFLRNSLKIGARRGLHCSKYFEASTLFHGPTTKSKAWRNIAPLIVSGTVFASLFQLRQKERVQTPFSVRSFFGTMCGPQFALAEEDSKDTNRCTQHFFLGSVLQYRNSSCSDYFNSTNVLLLDI